MASETVQERVRSVVEQALSAWHRTSPILDGAAREVTTCLAAAGLLVGDGEAALRERIEHVLTWARVQSAVMGAQMVTEEIDALLRELAGDGGAPASEPPPAPRRMAANPAFAQISGGMSHHATEHDETLLCAVNPPCQPVAAAHDPRDFDPGAGAPIGVLPADVVAARKHMERTRHVSVGEYAAPSHICALGIERAWSVEECTSCRGREHSPEAIAAKAAHEHRWAAVAWETTQGARRAIRRVTREHCVVGDCPATREVGHDA